MDLGQVSAPVYKLLNFNNILEYSVFLVSRWAFVPQLPLTALCLLMKTSVKGRKIDDFKTPAKTIWVPKNRMLLFELSMENT